VAWLLAERYGRGLSAVAESEVSMKCLDKVERWLDKNLLHEWEYVRDNKLSEALVQNAVLVAGATLPSVAAQRLYDQVAAPENGRSLGQ